VRRLRARAASTLAGGEGAAERVAAAARAADAAGGPPLLRFWPPSPPPPSPLPSLPGEGGAAAAPLPALSHALAPFAWYFEAAAGQALPPFGVPADPAASTLATGAPPTTPPPGAC
jgi:hypothetical protein